MLTVNVEEIVKQVQEPNNLARKPQVGEHSRRSNLPRLGWRLYRDRVKLNAGAASLLKRIRELQHARLIKRRTKDL
jgi:hypothetical protein